METLMFPLYGRARCSKLYPDIFPDKEAEALINRIYFEDDTVKGLFTSLAETYPGGGICFDARNEAAVFNTNKFIEKSGYSSRCHLAVNSARQKFSEWSDKFATVSTFRRLPEDVRNAESIPFTIRQEMAFAMKMGYFKIIEIGFAASA